MVVEFTDGPTLSQLDPKHVELCTAKTEFCQNVEKITRCFCSPDYTNLSDYTVDNMAVCFSESFAFQYLNDGEKEYQAAVYKKSGRNSPMQQIPLKAFPFVFFHEETKDCLGYFYRDGDNILNINLMGIEIKIYLHHGYINVLKSIYLFIPILILYNAFLANTLLKAI